MNITEGLSKKEIARRKKLSRLQSARMKKKREEGLKRYRAEQRRLKKIREKEKKEEKERLKKLRAKKNKGGRPKKRGRPINWNKRRRKKEQKLKRAAAREAERNKPYLYKIYFTRNGNREKMIGQYRTIEEAYERFKQEKIRSELVVFPRSTKIYRKVEESIDECLLVAKTDSGPTMIRNEYGKLVENRTNLEGWEVIDKFRNNVEETFWVWGYNNRKDRKDFTWIYNELLVRDGFEMYEFRRVFTFRNKLLVRYDDLSLNFVICKSEFDTIRLYNELQNKAKKDGYKQLIFTGDRSEMSEETKKLILELMEITGWSQKKVSMKNTTYYMTK